MRGSTLAQLWRFGVVGVGVNLALYAAYLALVAAHVGVKTAMSLAYVVGVTLSFLLNRRWTFASRASSPRDALAYLAVCLSGYLLNLAGLALMVDTLGWPHQAVQGAMVFVVAAFTFVLHKHWVFGAADPLRPAELAMQRPSADRTMAP